MNQVSVLVIGSGGREHAIVRSLSLSPHVGQIYAAPGNGGTAARAANVELDVNDHPQVLRFIEEKKIALTVIGPEAPLVAGLADSLRAKNHPVVGASRQAARLEGSKVYAKNFMAKYGIPTANFRQFDSAAEAKKFALSGEGRRFSVIKADGLAAGKGVVVTQSVDELLLDITRFMEEKKFGSAGEKILLEEKLEGREVSVMALTDGKTVLPFPPAQDHKRVFDNDKGPNTGGMGTYAPTPFYDDETRIRVNGGVIENFLRGINAEGLDFKGIIYFGLMLTTDGPKVLEFNVRLGDPETQAVLPLVQSDIYEAFLAVAEGKLSSVRLELKGAAACTVVLASRGYPGPYSSGHTITGLDEVEKEDRVLVFHAGTKTSGPAVVTSGGRVLNVTGIGRTLDQAVVRAYQGVKRIGFKNMHFRNDIAAQALHNKVITQRIKRMKIRHGKETTLLRT